MSNVYRTFLPRIVRDRLPRWMRPAPLPDDQLQRESDRIEDTAQMLARLSLRDQIDATMNGLLAKVLARLGAAIETQERESQNHPQPLVDSYIRHLSGVGLTGQHASNLRK